MSKSKKSKTVKPDLKQVLKKSKWTIDSYRIAVDLRQQQINFMVLGDGGWVIACASPKP